MIHILLLQKTPNHPHILHQLSILLQQLCHLANLQIMHGTLEEPLCQQWCNSLKELGLDMGGELSHICWHKKVQQARQTQKLTLIPANTDICTSWSDKLFLCRLPIVLTVVPSQFHLGWEQCWEYAAGLPRPVLHPLPCQDELRDFWQYAQLLSTFVPCCMAASWAIVYGLHPCT